jgi:hypothetical protein
MQWHVLIGSMLLCGIVGIGIWSYAYRLGLKHGQATTVPFRVIDELLDHKIHCLGQNPALARVELETTLNIESWEAQSFTQRVLQGHRTQKDAMTRAAHAPSAEVSSIL